MQNSKVGQRVGHVRVLRPKRCLPDAKCSLIQRLRRCKVARLHIRGAGVMSVTTLAQPPQLAGTVYGRLGAGPRLG